MRPDPSTGASSARTTPSIAELLRPLAGEAPPISAAGAAVLILLREAPAGPEVLLIQRTERPQDLASGHVSLPGGRVKALDENLRVTALRELREEVGLEPADLEQVPGFFAIRRAPAFSLDVAVFAASLSGRSHPPRTGDPHEVRELFWLPLSELSRTSRVLRSTASGPQQVDASIHRDFVLWGFTRRILLEFVGTRAVSDPKEGPMTVPAASGR